MSSTSRQQRYDAAFKEQAVEACLGKYGGNVNQAAQAMGLPVTTLHYWIKARRFASGVSNTREADSESLQDENRRLRKSLQQAEMEIEFLKKASAYFAKLAK